MVSHYARRVKSVGEKQHLGTCFKASTNQVIGTWWIIHNKLDEDRNGLRNKWRLIYKGLIQQKGIDFDETNASLV